MDQILDWKRVLPITTEQGAQLVSARQLFSALGMGANNWSRWITVNVLENPFAVENEDWGDVLPARFDEPESKTTDFALKLDFAKRLAMMTRTEKGEAVRTYFLECERLAAQPRELTRLELLRIGIEAEEARIAAETKNLVLEQQIAVDAPKVQIFDAILSTEGVELIGTVAKQFGLGPNKFMAQLRSDGILISGGMRHNEAYQQYVDAGYFVVRLRVIEGFNESRPTTYATPRGVTWLARRYAIATTPTTPTTPTSQLIEQAVVI